MRNKNLANLYAGKYINAHCSLDTVKDFNFNFGIKTKVQLGPVHWIQFISYLNQDYQYFRQKLGIFLDNLKIKVIRKYPYIKVVQYPSLTLNDAGGGPKVPTGQEIVCHFSQGHAMVTKNLDFISINIPTRR